MRPRARHRGAPDRPARRAGLLELLPQRHARDGGRAPEGGDAPARLAGHARRRRAPRCRPARASRSTATRFAGGLTRAIEAAARASALVREEVTAIPDGAHHHRHRTAHVAGAVRRRCATRSARRTSTSTTRSRRSSPPTRSTCTVAWKASRYDKGGDDYVNCPLDRDEYYAFVDAVLAAEKVPTRDFERCVYFEGCMPIEEMARRGPRHARLRADAAGRPGRSAHRHAAVRRACSCARTTPRAALYNMVGFQTKMTYPEQRRVFRMIPGLERAEFVRLGSLHRNTFVNSPALLLPTLQVIGAQAAAPRRAARRRRGLRRVGGDRAARGPQRGAPACAASRRSCRRATTALGSLLAYVTQRGRKDFQPMNANYGLFPPLGAAAARAREEARARRARARRRSRAGASGRGLGASGRPRPVVGRVRRPAARRLAGRRGARRRQQLGRCLLAVAVDARRPGACRRRGARDDAPRRPGSRRRHASTRTARARTRAAVVALRGARAQRGADARVGVRDRRGAPRRRRRARSRAELAAPTGVPGRGAVAATRRRRSPTRAVRARARRRRRRSSSSTSAARRPS